MYGGGSGGVRRRPPDAAPWLRKGQRIFRATVYCFNLHALLLCGLGCASVATSRALGLHYSLEFAFITFGLTFALTFNITQAFTRRERALVALAELKASVVSLYWQHRDWVQDEGFPDSLGNDRTKWALEFGNLCMQFLSNVEQYLHTTEGFESLSEIRLAAKRSTSLALLVGDTRLAASEDAASLSFISRVSDMTAALPGNRHLTAAYRCLSRMSVMNEYLTFKAHYSRGGEGGMSRTAQYFRYLMAQMENLRMIKLYRTPFMLRYSCSVLIHIGAVVLGPHFANSGACDEEGGPGSSYGCPGPYVMACIYGVICMLLLNVQASAEMPFDETGLDDVFLELASEFSEVLDLGRPEPVDDDGACFAAALRVQQAAAVQQHAAQAGPM